MPKQIQTYGPGQWLVRRFGLKGRFQPVLDETIVPVVVLPGDATEPEEWPAEGGQIGVAAGVGNQNTLRFSNPAASGRLLILDYFIPMNVNNNDFVTWRINAGAVGGGLGQWRDTRLGGSPAALLARVANVAIVIGPPLQHFLALEGVAHAILGPWFIEPDNRFDIIQSSANDTLDVFFSWRETALKVA